MNEYFAHLKSSFQINLARAAYEKGSNTPMEWGSSKKS